METRMNRRGEDLPPHQRHLGTENSELPIDFHTFSFKNPQKQSISEKQNRPSKSNFGSILRATPCIYIYKYMAKASLWTYHLYVFAMKHCCQKSFKFGLIRFQCSTIHCYWRLDRETFWIEPQALLHDFSNDVSQEKPANLEGHTQNPNCAVSVCRVGVENRVEDWGLGFWPKVKLREAYPVGLELKVTVDKGPEFWLGLRLRVALRKRVCF